MPANKAELTDKFLKDKNPSTIMKDLIFLNKDGA
jgi:hypothetical protein